MITPTYKPNYSTLSIEKLMELDWGNYGAPRDEYFMSETDREYTYGVDKHARTYKSAPYTPEVLALRDQMNTDFGTKFNVCFMNRYMDQSKWLGWHSDDSDSMDHDHPIAVVSFGVERFINWRPNGYSGKIPDEWMQKLENGSLFMMPAGFQKTHQHKIPKHDRNCGVRISLTFRRYVDDI